MKKITSLLLTLVMVLGTALTSFAADFDFYHETGDENRAYTLEKVMDEMGPFEDVVTYENEFFVEFGNKYYKLKDISDFVKANPGKTIADAAAAGVADFPKPSAGLKVVSVSAINAKTLKVDFNQVVSKEDQAKVNFEVKKGSVAVAVTPKWAEDGKSVELLKATKFAAGNYTVKASGIEFAENANTGSVEIKEEEATAIVIKSESLGKAANAPFAFEVQNQYKEAMNPAPAVTVVLLNKTEAGRGVVYNAGPPTGINTNNAEFGDEIQVTIFISAKPEIKTVKTLKVTGQVIDKIEFGKFKLEESETVLLPGKTITVPVKAFVGSNPVQLTGGAYTSGTAVDGLVPTWNNKDISMANFDGTKQELTLTVANATKPGEKTFNYVTAGGDIVPFKFEVVSAVSLELKEVAPEQVQIGEDVNVSFKVMLSDGSEAKSGALTGYQVKVTEKVTGKVNVTSPINAGAILNPQSITGAVAGKETLTYQLLDSENKEVGAPVVFDIDVVAAIDQIVVTADKTEYASGEDIVLTIQAKVGANKVDYTAEFKSAKVTVGTTGTKTTYLRDVNFVGGVATVRVPATKAFTPAELVEVDLLDDGTIKNIGTPMIEVKAAEAAKFEVKQGSGGAGKIQVTAQDKHGNKVVTFVGYKVLTITATNKDGDPVSLQTVNTENQVNVEFTSGVKDDIVLKGGAFEAGTVIRVSGEGLSGEYKIN